MMSKQDFLFLCSYVHISSCFQPRCLVLLTFQWSKLPLLYIGYATGCFIRPFGNLIKVFSEGPRVQKGPHLYQQECILVPSRLNKIVSISVQFGETSILESSTPYNIL